MESDDQPTRRKRKVKSSVYVNVTNCKYEIVRQAALKRQWKLCTDEDEGVDWNLYWTDTSVTVDRVLRMRDYQRINHFPGMFQIARKADLARTLNRMAKAHPQEYSYFPRSWVFPDEESDFRVYVKKNKSKHWTYIIKPNTGCQGKGIYLTRSAESVNTNEPSVAQRYLASPLLIDGYKFDLRIYLLVSSVAPLRLLLYREGLVRLCTERYQPPKGSNLDSTYMHLTNYAINKQNESFEAATEDGQSASKRRLSWFLQWVEDQPDGDALALWEDISHICISTLIGCQPSLAHLYKSCQKQSQPTSLRCFELLGFDILVDRDYKPWLIEVNHSPSFAVDSPLDHEIKLSLVHDTMKLLNLKGSDRRRHQKKSQAQAQQRLYGNRPKTKLGQNDSKQQVWAQYKKNENENKGKFSVIYPPEDAGMDFKHDDEVSNRADDLSRRSRRRSIETLHRKYSMMIETTTKLFQASTAGTSVSTGLSPNDRRLLKLMGVSGGSNASQEPQSARSSVSNGNSASMSRSTTPSVRGRVYPGILDDNGEEDADTASTYRTPPPHRNVHPAKLGQSTGSLEMTQTPLYSSPLRGQEGSRAATMRTYHHSSSAVRPNSPNVNVNTGAQDRLRWGMAPLRTTTFNFPQQPQSLPHRGATDLRTRPPPNNGHFSDQPRRPSTSGRIFSPRSDCLQACVHELTSPVLMKPRKASEHHTPTNPPNHDSFSQGHAKGSGRKKMNSPHPPTLQMRKSASGGNISNGTSLPEYRENSAARQKDRSSRGFEVINAPVLNRRTSTSSRQNGPLVFRKIF